MEFRSTISKPDKKMKQISMVREIFEIDLRIYTGLGVEVAGFGYIPWEQQLWMIDILNSLYAVAG